MELLIQATKENNELQAALEEKEAALAEKEAALADRSMAASEIGTMSDACLHLNGVFAAADAAAQQYLENVQNASAKAEEACSGLLEEAKAKAEEIVKEALKIASSICVFTNDHISTERL